MLQSWGAGWYLSYGKSGAWLWPLYALSWWVYGQSDPPLARHIKKMLSSRLHQQSLTRLYLHNWARGRKWGLAEHSGLSLSNSQKCWNYHENLKTFIPKWDKTISCRAWHPPSWSTHNQASKDTFPHFIITIINNWLIVRSVYGFLLLTNVFMINNVHWWSGDSVIYCEPSSSVSLTG